MTHRSRTVRTVVGLAVAGLTAALTPVTATSVAAAPSYLCAGSPAQSAPAGARAGDREPSAWKNPPIDEAPASHRGSDYRVTIPVHFHVFTRGQEGFLSETTLRQQVNVLNTEFAGHEGGSSTGFSFTFASADYTDNATWFASLDPGTSVEREAKAATHQGTAAELNVWTTNGPSYLGFATFPSWYKRSPQLDGVVLDYKSFPGGAFGSQFSLGKTATHETGHWLGLLHTFQGGCNDKGDYVADTPAQRTPTSGCPEGKDTCSAPGTDPIHNYMDYSFDSCYTQFTAGQAQRMRDQWSAFRADGGTAVGQP
jgi:hypothetical protein